MIICPICKKQLADGVRFCDGCGSPISAQPAPAAQPAQSGWGAPAQPAQPAQPQTRPADDGWGAAPASQPARTAQTAQTSNDMWNGTTVLPPRSQPQQEKSEKPDVAAMVKEKLSSVPKKFLLIGAIAVAALILIIIVASLVFGGAKKPNYALYIKDGEVQYSKLSGKAKEVTDELYDGATNQQLSQTGGASYLYTVSEDGKKLFYIDKLEDGGVLFVRSLSNFKKEPTKIDSDIESYVVNEKANLVTYLKGGDDYVLYQHNLKEKTKIAGDVKDYLVTKDGKKIVYLTTDGDLYVKQKGKDKVKLDSLVDSICSSDKNLSKLTYLKEGTLYTKNGNKDKVKIAGDVNRVINVYESGEIFYTVKEKAVDNSNSATDSMMPSNGNSGFDAQREFNEYVANMGADISELFYYNGKDSVKVSDVSRVSDYATDRPVLVYSYYDIESVDVDKLTAENFHDKMQSVFSSPEYCIAIKDKIHEIEGAEDISSVYVSNDGKMLYYFSDVSEKGEGDLFEAKISGKIGKSNAVDTDVYSGYISRLESGKYVYYKDVNDERTEGDLYISKKTVDTDVKFGSCRYSKDMNKLVYYTDYNTEKQQGMLKTATLKGKSTPISDDVHSYVLTPDGRILYLFDFSLNNYKGDLYISSGKKGKKLDEDVVAIFSYISFTDSMNSFIGYED